MWIPGKLGEDACEDVVVHQQCRLRDVERGGDHRPLINSDCAPTMFVVNERVARPVEFS